MQPGSSGIPKGPPVSALDLTKLTARTDLVLVPVVVTDRSGKPISALQKEAFRIEENGKERNISTFQEVKTEKIEFPAKPDGTESRLNYIPGDDHPWRLTAVVLDMINTPWMRQLEVKRQLIDYLMNP